MRHYADSSFLVSCYITDASTRLAKAYLSAANVPLSFNALQALEVQNALKLGVFRGLFSAADAASAWSNLQQDLLSGRLIKIAIGWPLVFRVAALLSKRHSSAIGTRSLDVLHVAAARSSRAADFLSFDSRQRSLAAAVGLNALP